MTTADVRQQWLSLVDAHVCHRHEPAEERCWCPEYDRMPRERLRQVQEEKLRLAVRYLHELSPMYRRKLDAAGIDPAGVRGLQDLVHLPIVTKEEMSASVAAHPPFGEYTAVDDDHWNRHGWMLFNTSGTTAQPRSFRYTDFAAGTAQLSRSRSTAQPMVSGPFSRQPAPRRRRPSAGPRRPTGSTAGPGRG